MKENNIFVPQVAEIENLFLLPEVIEIVSEKQDKIDVEKIISDIKERVFDFLQNNMEEQALLFTKQRSQNDIIQKLNKSALTMDEYKNNLKELVNISNIQDFYDQEMKKLQQIVSDKDYMAALKIINHKGLLPNTRLPNVFGWKKDYYIDYVLGLIERYDELRRIFKQYISDL